MAGERIVLAELDLDVQALIKASMETRSELSSLKDEQKELKKAGEENSAQYIRNEAEIKRLTPVVNAQTKAITAQVNETGKLKNATEALTEAVERENLTEQEYLDNNKKLYALRKDLIKTDADYQKSLDAINEKINENNEYLKENGSAMDKLKMNVGNYREDIVGAFEDLNLLNGGLLGFLSRAQAVGGVGPLISTSLKAISAGIGGITKASLTFLATPIGAVIGAIGVVLALVINYLKSTQEGIDMVTSVTRPLQAVFTAVMGVVQKVGKFLVDAFTNPQKSMKELYEFVKQNLINRFTAFAKIIESIMNLDFKGVVDGSIQAVTGVEGMTDKIAGAAKATGEFLTDAAKKGQEIDRLQKAIENGQLAFNRNQIAYNDAIDEQLKISKDTSKSLKEREAAAREIIRVNQQMGDEEAAIIQNKIDKLKLEHSLKEITREDQQELIDLEVELDAAQDKGLEAQLEQMRVISAARKEAAKEAAEAQQKILTDAITKLKLELDIFLQNQGTKIKALDEQIAQAEQVRQKQIEIAQAEFNASKKTENDKLELIKKNNDANLAFIEAQNNAVQENADRELENIINNNKTKLDNNKFLNDEMVKQERERLKIIADAERDNARVKLDNDKITLDQYNAEITRINDDNYKKNQDLTIQREQAERERKLTDLQNQQVVDEENFIAKMELEKQKLDIQREQELAEAEKTGADLNVIKDKYAQLEKNIEESVKDFKLQQRADFISSLKGLFGTESKLGKAVAVADIINSTVTNAAKAFQQASVYASNPFTAALAVNAAAQGGIIIATGALQVAKTVGAKFEKGGLVEIGGNRHSEGGTVFQGSDGTRFEAERGELIGVMNRNAARHFMAFNNSFPSGSGHASNYFANGGIVSREIAPTSINVDELANILVDALSSMPEPVVGIQDIVTAANREVTVRQLVRF